MKTITCSCGKDIQLDDNDFVVLQNIKFSCIDRGRIVKARSLHETPITKLLIQDTLGLLVDHIDRDPHNNQRGNLRLVTFAENSYNRGLSKKNRSGYKGVLAGYKGKWRAQIKVNGIAMNLGEYLTKEEAAKVYNEAARKHFGEYAYQNDIKIPQ